MMISRSIFVLIFIFVLCSGAAASSEREAGFSVLKFELNRLEYPASRSLESYAGKPSVLVFFQPECNWCRKQMGILKNLSSETPDAFYVAGIGVHGSRRALQAEFRRFRVPFEGYEATPALLAQMGGIPATPYLLVVDETGHAVMMVRGFIAQEDLLSILKRVVK